MADELRAVVALTALVCLLIAFLSVSVSPLFAPLAVVVLIVYSWYVRRFRCPECGLNIMACPLFKIGSFEVNLYAMPSGQCRRCGHYYRSLENSRGTSAERRRDD